MSNDGYRMNKKLTDKQKEIMPYLAEDRGNTYISKQLGVTETTIHYRVERMMDVLLCADRLELVGYAQKYMQEQQETTP